MKPSELPFSNTDTMPLLFLGHGNPMNAIEENEFVNGFRTMAQTIPKPNAIVCISAHWETNGTLVTAMEHPRTIHDFGGFPKELFDVQYPASGNILLANETKRLLSETNVGLDTSWGLDHGTWSVIKHLYPQANIPIVQLSIDYNKTPQQHYSLAQDLAALRQKGILIIGSGNLIHNLALIDWRNLNTIGYAYDWAGEAREKLNRFILDNDHKSLINYKMNGKELQLAIPTPEHFIPLLYILAMKDNKETVTLFNDKAIGGSLSMTSVQVA